MITVDLTGLPRVENDTFLPLFRDHRRFLVLKGGAGSGKSYFVADKLIYRSLAEQHKVTKHRFLVCRKVARTIRQSCFELIVSRISKLGFADLFRYNRSSMEITCRNGNMMLFSGLDDVEKLKSVYDITGIWGEEASEFQVDDIRQLNLRLRGQSPYYKQIILSFNPISYSNWLRGEYFTDPPRVDTTIHNSTYQDNKFIDDAYKAQLESYRELAPYYYQVYVLNEWGSAAGACFPEFRNNPNPERTWTHVIRPFAVPDGWKLYRSFDFGYSYQNMSGAAFRELLKLGVDEETAKKLSDDEALISGLVEMAGTGLDVATLGFGKLFNAIGGKKILSSAAQKVIGALAGYGVNIVGEGEEERAQSFISIANQRRAEKGEDTGLLGLIGDTAKLFYDAATGKDQDAAAQAAEEAAAGRRIAAMAGGGTLAVNTAIGETININVRNRDADAIGSQITDPDAIDALIDAGKGYARSTEAYNRAVGLEKKRAAGEEIPPNSVGRLALSISDLEETAQKAEAEETAKAQAKYAAAQKKNPTAEQEAAAPLRMPTDETLTGEGDLQGGVPLSQDARREAADAAYKQFEQDMQTTDATVRGKTTETTEPLKAKRVSEAKSVEEAADIVKRVGETDAVTMAETIGERGAVAQEKTLDEYRQVGDKTFTPAFARYYRAGMLAKNAPFSALQNQLGTEISVTTQQAAYEAGMADAARVKEAAYFGKNAGLVRDVEYYKAGVDEKTTRRLDALGKITGLQIKFKDQVRAKDGKLANASVSNGVLYIARDSTDPVMVAAIHESVHRIRETDPEAYNAINKALWDIVGDDFPAVSTKIEELKNRYGVTSQDFAEEEYTAQALGVVLSDGKVLDRFVENNPTGARKIVSAIRDIITKIKNFISKNALGLDKVQMEGYEAIQKDASKLEAAFESALDRQKARAAEVAEAHTLEEKTKSAKAPEVPIKYSLKISYSNMIDKISTMSDDEALSIRSKTPYIKILDSTPEILVGAGANDLPILIRFDAAYLAQRESGVFEGHYHNLGAEAMSNLPRYLSHPDVVLSTINKKTGNERLIVLTRIESKNGQGLASVEINTVKDIDNSYEYYNIVVTFFDVKQRYFNSLLKKYNAKVRYENEALAQVNPQLHEWLSIVNALASDNSISNPGEDVNEKYSLRYQQMLDEAGGENASPEDARKLLQANTILKERIAELKAQMKTTKAPTTDKKAVAQYVDELLKTESSTTDADSVTERLTSLYDYIAQSGDENNDLTWGDAKDRARNIAKDIIENVNVLVSDTYEEYADMRSFLHSTAVSISEKDKGDFRTGEFNELRKKNMGKLLITKSGTPVDVLWMELRERWPGMFPEDLTHNADMLRHMPIDAQTSWECSIMWMIRMCTRPYRTTKQPTIAAAALVISTVSPSRSA